MGMITCLNCAHVLAEIDPHRNGNKEKASSPPPRCELEEEDDKTFYRCPRCKAKNIVAEARTPSGFPELTIIACSLQ